MKKGIAFFDYLFILRLTLFYPVWIFFLAGYWGGQRFGNGSFELSSQTGAFWVLIGLTLLMGSVYIFNQICDIKTDRINQKLFLIADGYLSIREAYIEAGKLAISALKGKYSGLGSTIDKILLSELGSSVRRIDKAKTAKLLQAIGWAVLQ